MQTNFNGKDKIKKIIILMKGCCTLKKTEDINDISVDIEKDPREEVRIFTLGGGTIVVGDRLDEHSRSDVSVTISAPKTIEVVYG